MAYGPLTRTITAAGTTNMVITDGTVRFDATLGNQTYNLLAAARTNGKIFVIKKVDVTAGTVTISGVNIDGAASVVLSTQWSAIIIQSNGTTYDILGNA